MNVRYATYNPNHLYRPDQGRDEEMRFDLAEQVINEIEPDVLAIQELHATTQEEAVTSIHRLAEATGLRCTIDNSPTQTTTVIKGHRSQLATGLLWRHGIEPVVNSWRVIQPDKFWHALSMLTLDVGGVQVDHACYHGPPIARRPDLGVVLRERISEAKLIASTMADPGQNSFTAIGADWNTLSADKLGDDYYDYLTLPAGLDPEVAQLAQNRMAGAVLLDSGLVDVAPALPGASITTRQLTTGHQKGSKYGGRRIDLFRVKPKMLSAIRAYGVVMSKAAIQASDHLPVVLEYETNALHALKSYYDMGTF